MSNPKPNKREIIYHFKLWKKYFMDLRRMIYNFVNPHQELKEKTPAEIAEINLELGRNKLLNLIKFVRENYIILS